MKAWTGASICLANGSSTAHSRADSAMTRHARWRTWGPAGRVARNRRLSSPEGAVDEDGCGGCGDRRMCVATRGTHRSLLPGVGAAPPDDFGESTVAANVVSG